MPVLSRFARLVVIAGLCIGAATSASAIGGERKLSRRKVPPAVLATAQAHAPKASMTAFAVEESEEKTVYEVRVNEGGRVSDLMIAPDGKLLSEEIVLAEAELPEAVRKAVAGGPHAKGKIVAAEKLIDHANGDAVSFEVEVEEGATRTELVFTPEGVAKAK